MKQNIYCIFSFFNALHKMAAQLSEEVGGGCMSNSCLGHVAGIKSNNKVSNYYKSDLLK